MTSPTKVVLLSCGSFNPITNMHLRLFELARDSLNKTGKYNVIGGIISPASDGYNKKDLESAKHRCSMIDQALKTSNWIKLDKWECSKEDWTTTAKVMAHFRDKIESDYNERSRPLPAKKRKKLHSNEGHTNNIPTINLEEESVQLKLLCGADLLESFGTPGLWAEEDIEDIINNYGLVCVTRAGSDPHKFIYESDTLTRCKNNIHIITEWIFNDISSTKIRRALRRGESVKYLLQDNVIDYIRKHQIYHIPDNKYINHMMPSPNDEATTASPDTEEESFSSLDVTPSPTSSTRSRDRHDSIYHSRHHHSPDIRNYYNQTPQHVTCMTDISSLVRRVKNIRVAYTPETCV
ncbi:hypothetical protein SNE40_007957 [Patella caerulea]|uniref:Nicotinamide-nucleotide adenylyltransferase n=1 Tax=Patella caerulea TaxID=87958 RepID=A0AAN8K4N1_PATCE